jgi:hypothetical protein
MSASNVCKHARMLWAMPDFRITQLQRRLQRTSGALNQQSAQIDIAAQADMSERRPATGAVLARRQAKPGTELPAIAEDLRVGNGRSQATGCYRTDAEQFAGASCNVTASGVSGDLLVAAGKPQV